MASSRPDFPPLSSTGVRGSISAIPMSELEPSPVDEEPPDLPSSPKNSAYAPSTSQSTNFLGLTPARTLHLLTAAQKYSTLGPSIYLTMHYANTALIPLITRSVPTADRLLLLTRPYYQSFPLEPLLILLPLATHILSGVTLRIYRRRQSALRHGAETHADRRSLPWPKLSLTSALGYALYPMLAGHFASMRAAPIKVDDGSSSVGLRYFAHGIAKHPVLANAGYAVMLCVASWHVVTGGAKFLHVSREYVVEGGDFGVRKRRRRDWIVNGLAACVAALWIAGGLGVVGRYGSGTGWEATNWDRIYKAVPILGRFI